MKRRRLQALFLVAFLGIDAIGLYASFQTAFVTRFHWAPFLRHYPITKGYPGYAIYKQALYILLPIWLLVFYYIGAYKEHFISAYDELVRVVKGIFLCAL